MRLPLFVFHIGISHSLYRNTRRGFLFSFDCRVAKLVGRDDPIAPPTRNEGWPCSREVKRNEGERIVCL